MYRYIPRMTQKVTEFFFNENIFVSDELLEICKNSRCRVVILADQAIAKIAGARLKMHLNAELISIKGGESCKTRETKELVENELLKKKYNRDTLIIAMGGGALTDLVGFIAMTYMRGVPLILIPTTLLGMVDAAIGGKNGINTSLGKNLIGSIYQPQAVFIDPQLLSTLPKKEWLNGLAEILKMGLIFEPAIWKMCEQNPIAWQSPQNLKTLLHQSVMAKLHILDEDLEEQGMRRVLNFGHTVGHALEMISKYKMTHGQAVAMGCMAESWLSSHLGHLSFESLNRILKLYQATGFEMSLPKAFTAKKFKEALQRDKKALQGLTRFVMIERIGHCASFAGAYCAPISETELDALIDWMSKQTS